MGARGWRFSTTRSTRKSWSAIERGELGYSIAPQLEAPKPLRDWMTPEELRRAAVAENRATVSRWLKGKNLPRRREFRPWEHPAVPVDESLPKRRRIWVPGINPAFWQTDFMRQELDAILTVRPK